jgi:hypothetical protein
MESQARVAAASDVPEMSNSQWVKKVEASNVSRIRAPVEGKLFTQHSANHWATVDTTRVFLQKLVF